MFERIQRSWGLACASYRILWDNKSLLIFPILSSIAVIVVTASFLLPMWKLGMFESLKHTDASGHRSYPMPAIGVLFLFYFTTHFVIFFFNSALTACALRAVSNGAVSVGYGLRVATSRLPQILAWSAVSALIGVLLQIIESAHEKAGAIISAVLGTAWSVITYFVVPVIVLDGLGPMAAVKRSTAVLKETWGEGLVGNFSLGLVSMVLGLPVFVLAVVLMFVAGASGGAVAIMAIMAAVCLLAMYFAATSAASVVFRAVLYNFATGATIPESIDRGQLTNAFGARV